MTGVAKFVQPDFTSQGGTAYKTAIDASVAVMARIGAAFAPHEQTPQAMAVTVDAGAVVVNNTPTEVAAQNVTISAAPVAPNSRIDRIVINTAGVASVVLGTPANTPVPPLVPEGYRPVARVYVGSGFTAITNADITDERMLGSSGNSFANETSIASAGTTDLGQASGHLANITGTTTITSFGSNVDIAAPIYVARFSGALTLTHNATSLILPGGANIAITAGDAIIAQYLGSGNWKVLFYQPISPAATTSKQGIVRLATGAQVQTGTATDLVAPLSEMVMHQGMAKAWAYFNASGVVQDSYGVASVTRNSTGRYTLAWSTNFANALYAVVTTTQATFPSCTYSVWEVFGTKTASAVSVGVGYNCTTEQTSDAACSVIAMGDR